ncbi:hypothetical protein ASG52_04370 [Methylobacterium sp. Leaf456]|uniref:hypothetical protein n=1 Tax=Methylobacterium sp. Leaf456 TaxID=1736382 RepID=UPI0006F92B74|nr:hypothetical protein [Methylobacterium sp. Leaf456]KQT53365.1 hypothetical protein ASG52_04370 [Methylobacterium sp. Leaf456]
MKGTICAVAFGFAATAALAQDGATTIASEGAASILAPKSRSRIQTMPAQRKNRRILPFC